MHACVCVWVGMLARGRQLCLSSHLLCRTRRLLRKGRVQLVVLNDKGKYVKSKTLELFLFNDMMQYCKPVRHKRTNTLHYVVYKQVRMRLWHFPSGYGLTDLPTLQAI